MEILWNREGFRQYMRIRGLEINTEDYALNKYQGAKIQGMLPLELQILDGQVTLCYEVSGCTNLEQMFQEQEMGLDALHKLFSKLWKVCGDLEEYLLPVERIMLRPEFIFYRPSNQEIYFAYLPGDGEQDFRDELKGLVEFCMKRAKHVDSRAVMFVYGLYRKIQDEEVSLRELMTYMQDFAEEEIDNPMYVVKKEVQQELLLEEEKQGIGLCSADMSQGIGLCLEDLSQVEHSIQQKKTVEEREPFWKEHGFIKRIFGMAAILCGMGMILFLARFLWVTQRSADMRNTIIFGVLALFAVNGYIRYRRRERELRLVESSMKKWEKIEPDFHMGREEAKPIKSYVTAVDERLPEERSRTLAVAEETNVLSNFAGGEEKECYVLRGLSGQEDIELAILPMIIGRQAGEADLVIMDSSISRRHASLYVLDHHLYIEDLGSTNGTYVGNHRLKEQQSLWIKEGDSIVLGRLRYQVALDRVSSPWKADGEKKNT